MIGVVLATHGGLGEALIAAMEMIAGAQPRVAALSLQVADRLEDAAGRLQATVAGVDEGDGVLVLTDMLGGTPSNICLSLLGGAPPVEVVSGANLPMLLKAVQTRREAGLAETAALVRKAGRAAIIVAGEVLAGPAAPGPGEGRA
jgi:PTS system mannose-specific IIA component